MNSAPWFALALLASTVPITWHRRVSTLAHGLMFFALSISRARA